MKLDMASKQIIDIRGRLQQLLEGSQEFKDRLEEFTAEVYAQNQKQWHNVDQIAAENGQMSVAEIEAQME